MALNRFNELRMSLSIYLRENTNATDTLIDRLHDQGVISDTLTDELQNMTAGNERDEYLIVSIETVLKSNPNILEIILDQLRTFEGLKDIVDDTEEDRQLSDAEAQSMLDAINEDMIIKTEMSNSKRNNSRAEIEIKLKQIFGDEPIDLNAPIIAPRFPGRDSTTEEKIAWIEEEFGKLRRFREERRMENMRSRERVDRKCYIMMEYMKRERVKFDKRIAEIKAKRELEKKELLKKYHKEVKAIKGPAKQLLSKMREYNKEQIKCCNEMYDGILASEKELEAVDRILEEGTEFVVEQSYKCSIVPQWTHPSLLKAAYAVTPVYRTLEGFEEMKKDTNEKIYTDPFYTSPHGYKMTLRVLPNGSGQSKGSHVSVIVCLMKGDNDHILMFPITDISISIKLLNWTEDNGHYEHTVNFDETLSLKSRQRVTDGERATTGYGIRKFISHRDLKSKGYLHNDMMCFSISSDIIIQEKIPHTVTMHKYSLHKKTNIYWTSEPFYTSKRGYKLQLMVFANGYGYERGTHVSVFVRLLKGKYDEEVKWPLKANILVRLLSWNEDGGHFERILQLDETIPQEYNQSRQRVTNGEIRDFLGLSDFISHHDLETKGKYLHDDMLRFSVSSEVIICPKNAVPDWHHPVSNNSTNVVPYTVTMSQYSLYKNTNSDWHSKPFYSSRRGYKLQLEVSPNGDESVRGTHVSVFVCLMKGEYDKHLKWPFNANIIVQLLNWFEDSGHFEQIIYFDQYTPLVYRQRVTHGEVATFSQGIGQFISHHDLETNQRYLHNDMMCFNVLVDHLE